MSDEIPELPAEAKARHLLNAMSDGMRALGVITTAHYDAGLNAVTDLYCELAEVKRERDAYGQVAATFVAQLEDADCVWTDLDIQDFRGEVREGVGPDYLAVVRRLAELPESGASKVVVQPGSRLRVERGDWHRNWTGPGWGVIDGATYVAGPYRTEARAREVMTELSGATTKP